MKASAVLPGGPVTSGTSPLPGGLRLQRRSGPAETRASDDPFELESEGVAADLPRAPSAIESVQPPAPGVRRDLERRSGRDFSQVRVHAHATARRPDASRHQEVAAPGGGPLRLQRKCACGAPARSDGGKCDQCRTRQTLQARLSMGPSDDPAEREADRVAEQVIDGGAQAVRSGAPPRIQRLASAPSSAGSKETVPGSVDRVLADPGQAMAAALREDMDSRFGQDFSQVRVHADATAQRSAAEVGAEAYTVGRHIVFGAGRYAPDTRAGRRLIAHELTHVVQQGAGAPAVLRRSRCGHDGSPTKCGAQRGTWKLTDQDTGESGFFGLDDLVIEGGMKLLGADGEWARQVQSPPNLAKTADAERGRIDGVKVKPGTTLSVEIVEVKSRSDEGGGCLKATAEANGYINELKTLAPLIPPISAKLAAGGGLKVEGGKCKTPKAADRARLVAAGVDFDNPSSVNAWCFYNSLQDRLNTTFTTAFTAVNVAANADGDVNKSFPVPPPIVVFTCRKTKKNPTGRGLRYLSFQVNRKGGVSYGCRDDCDNRDSDEDEKRKEKTTSDQKQDEVRANDDFRDIDKYMRLDQTDDQTGGQPTQQVGPTAQPQAPDSTRDIDEDRPVQLPPGGVSEWEAFLATGTVITTVATLHVAMKYAKTKAERELARKLIEDTIEKGTQRGALAIAKKLDSANLAKYGTREGDVLLKGADEALVIAAKSSPRIAARLGPTALKGLSKAAPIIGLVLAANDARAAISHVSKGGTIELGPSLDDKELKGDTSIKGGGDAKQNVSGDVSLNDTVIDVDAKGMPQLDGSADIQADKVTVRGAQTSEGGAVTLNMKVRISNTTITLKNNGVIHNGKLRVSGTDIKDSEIEIDLPAGATDPGRPDGESRTITGVKMKVTSIGGGTGTGAATATGPSTATPAPGTQAPGTTGPGQGGTTTGPAAPVAGADRPRLIQQIAGDPDLQKLYQALAAKEGVVVSDEALRRFVGLAPLIKRHPQTLQTILGKLAPGNVTDALKEIIEPIEQALQQENLKLGQNLAKATNAPGSGTPGTSMTAPPATGGGSAPANNPPTTNPGTAGGPPSSANPGGQGGTTQPAPVDPVTAIVFSQIIGQLNWATSLGEGEFPTPPQAYAHTVEWKTTVDNKELVFDIALSLTLVGSLDAGPGNLWQAQYSYKVPAGTFVTTVGDVPIRFSDAGTVETINIKRQHHPVSGANKK